MDAEAALPLGSPIDGPVEEWISGLERDVENGECTEQFRDNKEMVYMSLRLYHRWLLFVKGYKPNV